MGISIGFGRGKEIRDHVLAHFAAHPCAVQTAKQIFDNIDTVEHRTDLADALRQMVALGEMAMGDERQPGEPGGMSGPGARAVKSYRLPDAPAAQTAQPTVDQAPDDAGAEDGLIQQLDRLSTPSIELTPLDVQRIRAVASHSFFEQHLPDWALYFHGLADRITQIIDTRAA